MWKYVFEIGVNFFDYMMLSLLLQKFLKKQRLHEKVYIGMLCLCAAIMAWVNVIYTSGEVNIICSLVIVFILACTYRSGVKVSIFFSGVYAVISLFTEFIAALLIIYLKKIPDLLAQPYSGSYMAAVILSKLFLFICIQLLILRKKDYTIDVLPKFFAFFLFTIPVMSCAILLCNMDSYYFVDSDVVFLKILGLLALLYINIIVFLLFDRCNAMAGKIIENRLITQEIKYKEQYYQALEQNQQEMREMRHNLNNQILGFKHQLSKMTEEEADDLLKEMKREKTKIYTENPILHSIIADKVQKAKQNGIEKIQIEIRVPKKLSIQSGDLGIIIGNLMDNAIEANMVLKEEMRYLKVNIAYLQKNLLLKIENPISVRQQKQYQSKKTWKKDTYNHGIGLKSIEKILKSYDANMEIDCGETFVVKIIFFHVL